MKKIDVIKQIGGDKVIELPYSKTPDIEIWKKPQRLSLIEAMRLITWRKDMKIDWHFVTASICIAIVTVVALVTMQQTEKVRTEQHQKTQRVKEIVKALPWVKN